MSTASPVVSAIAAFAANPVASESNSAVVIGSGGVISALT